MFYASLSLFLYFVCCCSVQQLLLNAQDQKFPGELHSPQPHLHPKFNQNAAFNFIPFNQVSIIQKMVKTNVRRRDLKKTIYPPLLVQSLCSFTITVLLISIENYIVANTSNHNNHQYCFFTFNIQYNTMVCQQSKTNYLVSQLVEILVKFFSSV